jgi:hypothetical protein
MTSKVIKIKGDIVMLDDKYYEKQKSSDYLCGTLVDCDDCSLNKFSGDLIGELCDDCDLGEYYVDITEDVWERGIFGQDEEYVDISPQEIEQQLKDALGLQQPQKKVDVAALVDCVSKGVEEGFAVLSDDQVSRMIKGPLEDFKQGTNPLDVQIGGGHYKEKGIQPVQYIHANGLDFFEGNAIKYLTRWRTKGGLKDLEKAKHYIDLLIELEGLKE